MILNLKEDMRKKMPKNKLQIPEKGIHTNSWLIQNKKLRIRQQRH
jgi:hypothetical protein